MWDETFVIFVKARVPAGTEENDEKVSHDIGRQFSVQDSVGTFTKSKYGTKCYLYHSYVTDSAKTERRYVPMEV